MKKILSLILALAVCVGAASVTSFAATTYYVTSISTHGDSAALNGNGTFFPGSTYYYDSFSAQASGGAAMLSLDTSNYSVSAKWTKGGAMVSSVSIDNSRDAVKIVLNQNYTLTTEKELIGTITLTAKNTVDGYAKGDKIVLNIDSAMGWGVCNDTEEIVPYDNWDDAESAPFDASREHLIYTADGAGKAVFASDTSLIQLYASLKDNQDVAVYMNEQSDYDVIDYLDEKNVEYDELAFYQLEGKFSFSSGRAEAVIQSDFGTKPYIYSWNGAALAEVKDAAWDAGEGTYTVAVTGPTTIVLSEQSLSKAVAGTADDTASGTTGGDATTTNPDTGANDFVGLAVALAVVAGAGILVAKKK